MITTYEDEERPLVLLDALLHLGFVPKSCPYLRSMRTSNKNILLTGKEMSPVIQENLYKLLCAVLNCVPTQQQGGVFDDNLLVTYLDQVHETNSFEEHFFGVIKNLINRPAFQLSEIQTYLISTKFQKLSNNYQRKDAIRESPTAAQQQNFEQMVREQHQRAEETLEFQDWKEADVAVKDNSFERNAHLYYQNRADSRTGSRMTNTDRNQFMISRGIMS